MSFLSYIWIFMFKDLNKEGIKSIFQNYDIFFIDIWGVIHNGIELHQNSIKAINEISLTNKEFVLLTNAPRPNKAVRIFLQNMGLEKKISNKVYTSGQAALDFLNALYMDKKFYHIGPPRDFDLFKLFENKKEKKIDNSDYILCTGLFDEFDEDLNYYEKLLNNSISKEMICTNPDLIVNKGNKIELCAGSVAKIFEKAGGKVTYFGKPYPEIYKHSINFNRKKVLAIGDNFNTDIRGANNMNFDSLAITNGIHKDEIKNIGIEEVSKKYKVKINFFQSELKW